MSELALRPWASPFVSADPYPERREPELGGMDEALYRVLGGVGAKPVDNGADLVEILNWVDAPTGEAASYDDAQLRQNVGELRRQLIGRGLRLELVGKAFALVREATMRRLGLRQYPVQLLGGFALLRSRMAEMQTGEGKTITALLPAVTASLCGIPVHVITVNDYLAKRDYELLRPVYETLGLTVGLIQQGEDPLFRRNAYSCDVTYVTNKEVAFDYLRDRISLQSRRSKSTRVLSDWNDPIDDAPQLLLRGLQFAIVDEADSVLIDEARTPLIISSSLETSTNPDQYNVALSIAGRLVDQRDFQILEKERSVKLTATGSARAAELAAERDGVWRSRRAREELVEQALSALSLFERDKHYIVSDNKIQIVDEFTGRVMPDRSWERGLQQLMEAKEQQAITGRRHTLAQITYQRFFRRYLWLAGMTGTASEVARELKTVYDLKVSRIPTNRPVRRADRGIRVFKTAAEKWDAVIGSIATITAAGRPVLIGTRSVAASDLLGKRLTRAGFQHVVLNAHQDKLEAEIIARAGDPRRITVATNMAGRGTDVRLADGVADLGGLHVILTEFHESPRIDRQLFGRAGRQGDPGTFEAVVSLEDEIFSRFASRLTSACSRLPIKPGCPIPRRFGRMLRTAAQASAERFNLGIRRENMRRYKQLDKALAFAGIPE
jgi:preprotein translocase subunit SecA